MTREEACYYMVGGINCLSEVRASIKKGRAARLRPGAIMARAQADELPFNEAQDEVVFVKYLH